ncbi:putative ribonuclease H-like domain-containing protein [Tanacetum coccineum]|uniref:Ribonuclease H-like domain-containing protein n=1 Tax=Tanacetum coccineum TaxID=301880 RepID=A0ABQ4XNM4_9ASTR
MLEAVADQKLWIWHAYFGAPGANNDLNVLYDSPLFDDELVDKAPECPFVVNGHTYKKGYYLADDIYPAWSTFVKTFSIARDEKTLKFKRVQESSRKDIEQAFGVLQVGIPLPSRDKGQGFDPYSLQGRCPLEAASLPSGKACYLSHPLLPAERREALPPEDGSRWIAPGARLCHPAGPRCTLSLVSEHLKDLAKCMDDGDSRVAKEAKLFDALEHKSVVIEVDNKNYNLYQGATFGPFGGTILRYLYHAKLIGKGAWDAELLTLAIREILCYGKVLENMGFVHRVRMNLPNLKRGIDVIDLLEEEVEAPSEAVSRWGKANATKAININNSLALFLDARRHSTNFHHFHHKRYKSLTPKQREKWKEVIKTLKYTSARRTRAILEVLENYVMYKKKLDEILIGKERLNKKEFSEEDKVGIIEHGLPKKMCDPKNYVLFGEINGVMRMDCSSGYRSKCDGRMLGLKDFKMILRVTTAQNSDNSYLRDILGDILGKDMHYPFTRTTSTTLTAKLPILNPGDYNLWLMRIEQYFFMTDYSLCEVIKNEEKQDRRNEMKARGTMLIALPNKDQLKFHSYKDAKLLMEAIEKRYGGNKESKKVQRTLLKQQYENFAGSSSETMDQTFDRSLPSEWKTHALIWRNKQEIKTISLDDLYNNLKIYEPEISGSSSTSQNPQNVAFMSSNSNSSTNEADNTAYGASAAYTQSNPASGDNLSDAVICAILASQPNSPQLAQEDLEQINPDDLEEMDLQWEMAMLTIRATIFIKRIGRKLDVNGQRVGFYRTKVECYNCHKYGHFARECKPPRNQENKGREINRRTVKVETPTENALVAQDGIGGYDWSYQAEEEHPINFALMAHTSSGSSSSLDSELLYAASPAVESFLNSSEMLENQEYNKSKYDKGYHVVPPPFIGNFIPRKPDLTFIDEIVETENMDVTTVVTPSNVIRIIKDWNSDDESEVEIIPTVEDKTVRPSIEKIKFVKSARETIEKVIRPVWNNSSRVNHKNFANKMTHPHPNRRFVPQAVLTRSGKINTVGESVNTAGARINTAFRPVNTAGLQPTVNHLRSISNTYKKGYSQVTRPFNINKNNIFNKKVNTVRVKDTTARYRAVVSEYKGKGANAVKASACWGNPQQKEYKEKGVIDSGCSRHMTGNKCYLSEYEYYDGGLFPLEMVKKIENQLDHKVKVIRCDNGTEFKNSVMNQFCEMKGIKREFSVARTPQQNGVAERRNRTLIEAARTMLVDSKLPTTFWAEAVNTACYVLNRVLVIKPHNKTPYELIRGRPLLIDFMKPFGCPVTILNTRDHLGKFDGKADEGFFVGYSVVSKAIRVFNKRTRIVEETLNIRFLEINTNVTGNGLDCLFDVDSLTISMNYVPVIAGNQTNGIAGTRDNTVTGQKPIEMDKSGASDKDGKDDFEMDKNGASDKDGKDD